MAAWDPTSLPVRPGVYVRFLEAAQAIVGGQRGVVAIPLLNYDGGTAAPETVYEVESETAAIDLFGESSNIRSIRLALQGGASKVVVYTMPESPQTEDYAAMRAALDAYDFNVFVFDGEFNEEEQTAAIAWAKNSRDLGKHFFVVIGGDAASDANPSDGNSRSTTANDDYVVNLITGGISAGTAYTSAQYAPYIAGLIAGTPLNSSITYDVTTLDDVNKRLTLSEQDDAILAGSLALINDGEKVKVLSGVTTSGSKIRAIRVRQAVATDIARTGADAYIGKLNNDDTGRAALISAVLAYMESLEAAGALQDPVVTLDPENPPVGDRVYLLISYVETDSIERIFLTVSI